MFHSSCPLMMLIVLLDLSPEPKITSMINPVADSKIPDVQPFWGIFFLGESTQNEKIMAERSGASQLDIKYPIFTIRIKTNITR